LATGTILYVVTQLVRFEAKTCSQDLLAYGLHMGLIAGFLTDTIVLVAGA
jgi:zinc transporter, ZIP family